MSLTEDYAKTLYSWLSTIADTYRLPIQEGTFDNNNPQPNEYIAYSANCGNFGEQFIQALNIYSKSTAYTKLMRIVDKIEDEVRETGKKLSWENGYMIITKGSPFYQDREDEDSSYRAGYVNLLITIYQYQV